MDSKPLNKLKLPGFDKTLGDLQAVRSLETDEAGVCRAVVELPVPGYPHEDELKAAIETVVRDANPDVGDVAVRFKLNVKGPQSGGTVGLRVKNVIAVGSGKGGVGKSTISASLAFGLQSLGASVGLLDADVYGPSIPHLTGASGKPEIREHLNPDGKVLQRIHPVQQSGLSIMSIGFLIPECEAVIWRGPMLHKLLTQFISETEWGELDYLIVDMPPGTGDVALTLSQMMSLAGAVVVCTPQKLALLDAVKAIAMYEKVNIPILGMVENMSGDLFGSGGAEQTAREKGIPFLGEVPTDPQIRIESDASQLQQLLRTDNPSRIKLEQLAANLAMETARQHFKKAAAPTLEILQ